MTLSCGHDCDHVGSDSFWEHITLLAENEDERGEEWAFAYTKQLAEHYTDGDIWGLIKYVKENHGG